jgi:hypothetical protein
MKVSEVIQVLQNIEEIYGDIDTAYYFYTTDHSSYYGKTLNRSEINMISVGDRLNSSDYEVKLWH